MLAANLYELPVVILSAKTAYQVTFPPIFTAFDKGTAEKPIVLFHEINHFDAAVAFDSRSQQFPRVDPQFEGLASRYLGLDTWLISLPPEHGHSLFLNFTCDPKPLKNFSASKK